MDVNALFYHACKNGCIRLSATLKEMLFSLKKDATLKEMLFSLKKDAIVVSICWNQTFIPLQKIQLIVWWEILEIHHMLLQFFFFTQYSAHVFFAFLNALHQSSSFCWSQFMDAFMLCVGPRHYSLRYVLLLWKCCILSQTYAQHFWLYLSSYQHGV